MSKLSRKDFTLTGGVNYASAWDNIADNEAIEMVDVLLDQPGLTRRRGPINNTTIAGGSQATLSYPAYGMAVAKNSTDQSILVVANGDNSTNKKLSFYSSAYTTKVDFSSNVT